MTEAPGDRHGRGGSRSDDEIYHVAEEWAAVLNRAAAHQAEGIIIEAALDACFDDRTSLLLMSEGRSMDLALVVSAGSGDDDDYLVVRFDGEAWAVDSSPVDWDALEDATFAVDEPAALCLRASSTKARAAGES